MGRRDIMLGNLARPFGQGRGTVSAVRISYNRPYSADSDERMAQADSGAIPLATIGLDTPKKHPCNAALYTCRENLDSPIFRNGPIQSRVTQHPKMSPRNQSARALGLCCLVVGNPAALCILVYLHVGLFAAGYMLVVATCWLHNIPGKEYYSCR